MSTTITLIAPKGSTLPASSATILAGVDIRVGLAFSVLDSNGVKQWLRARAVWNDGVAGTVTVEAEPGGPPPPPGP